ncbi:BadF/BadG/BcrA/BcrD ATPase family protein [Neomegalonema sp.]|uniref:BadF/BadG/BcrA/BcrD ATPase family protein n=1 Tax=Neomegalonema sp. TaxID=2039713 RepID=UPI00260821FE|nr:BadF/BadG/BcrA/BcrD ATPase family protein [Neomegalonema sp.]MDD2869547.1 BadF/BadG/BcrA/BcrD ATPase family protein [Neomegalonema sp.]
MGETLYFGLDGGGTGSRARLTDAQGRKLSEAEAGMGAIATGDGSASHASILEAARLCVERAGLPPEAVRDVRAGLGVSGAPMRGARERLRARGLPFARTVIGTDGHTACLGAHGGEEGGLVIFGTGCVGGVFARGRYREAGGWGFACDDFGSGADMGRRAVHLTMRAADGDVEGGRLAEALLKDFGGDPRDMGFWAATATPGEFGRYARLIFDLAEEGDAPARSVVARSVEECARLTRIALDWGAPSVVLHGSIARRLRPLLPEALLARIVEPKADALEGALIMARRGKAAVDALEEW